MDEECSVMVKLLGRLPAICTPLTGKTREEIMDQLGVVRMHLPDVIEWRADFFHELADTELVLDVIREIKEVTEIPLLFTIRAQHEGGERIVLTDADKLALVKLVCAETAVEMVDVETSNGDDFVRDVRAAADAAGKRLILSYHNFEYTPDNAELMKRAQNAEKLGADFVKLAVMPQDKADVFQLLHVTKEIDEALDVPVITMSMGDVGGLSRIIGWVYGSVLTFGVGVELSAPGQMPVKELREAIRKMQDLVPKWEK